MSPSPAAAKGRATILSLAAIYGVRMLGLFMILPVFALYADKFSGATPYLIGFALGIYGLVQACLQIPFGTLSDRIGRKPLMTAGLLMLAVGSVVAALSHSIWGIIIGRALQGAGAIGSTILALVADLTPERARTKAMAVIGMLIGTSFIVAMVIGPLIGSGFGLQGIFWFTAVLALLAILILHTLVPTPGKVVIHQDVETVPALFGKMLKNTELLRLDFGIFILHAMLTALFIAIPIVLVKAAGLDIKDQPLLYLPVLILAFITMVPLVIVAEKKRKMKPVFLLAIALLASTQLGLYFATHSIIAIAACLFVYFVGFCLLEATLPSMISKIAPASSKGTAMGIYSTCQFLGIFIGGVVGGTLYAHYDLDGIFLGGFVVSIVWLGIAATMSPPHHVSTELYNVGTLNGQQASELKLKLAQINGIADVAIIQEQGADHFTAHLKVDKHKLDQTKLKCILGKQQQPEAIC